MLPPSADRQEGLRDRQQDHYSSWQWEQRDDLTLSEARHILRERRALVAGCALLFLAVALLYGLLQEPVYTAEATLSVRSEGGAGVAGSFDELREQLQDPAGGPGLSEEAARRAGWGTSAEDLQDFNSRLAAERSNDDEVKTRFSASEPEEAARAANAYADVFVERVRELQGRLAGGTVTVSADVEKYAEAPERRSDPGVLLVAILATGGGILVGGVGALFLESRARRWSGYRDAELTLRAPVLGVIPDHTENLSDGSAPREEASP